MHLTQCRFVYPLLASLTLAGPAILASQSPAASGGFVLLEDTDTIATMRFTRDAQILSVTMHQVGPQTFRMSYIAHVIDAAGTQRVEYNQTYMDGSAFRRQTVYSAMQFRERSTGSNRPDQTRDVRAGTRPFSVIGMLIPSLEELIRGVHVAPGDSTKVFVHNPRSGDTATVRLRRVKADSVVLTGATTITRLSISPASDILRGSIQYPQRTWTIVRVP